MTFDATIAIAQLDLASGTDRPDLDSLRSRYPELQFVFDQLEDTLLDLDACAIEHRDEKRELERAYASTLADLEERVQDMRLAFEQIRELTLDTEITSIIDGVL